MPLPSTLTPIATVTLTSNASNVTFSNLPQTYTDLVLVTTNTDTGAGLAGVYLDQINGDTGSNYSRTILFGTGSAASSDRDSGTASNIGLSNTTQCNNIFQFMNYSNTTTYKTVLSRANSASGQVRAGVALWRNTAAITSFRLSGVTFASGSSFTVYGVKAA